MKPEDIIKYVFEEEGVDFQLLKIPSRKFEMVQARQRAAYLVHYFYPFLTLSAIRDLLLYDSHATVLNCFKKVTNFIATEKKYEREMAKYITVIRKKIERANKFTITDTAVKYKMKNKRLYLMKADGGFILHVCKLDGREVVKQTLSFTDEAMAGIVESYKILTQK